MRTIFVLILSFFLSVNSLGQLLKIDSTCINNPELSSKKAHDQFLTELENIITKFIESENIELSYFLDYEDSIRAENISLGHYWSLGKSIYPNKKKYVFGNPISFRRIECPHFDGIVTYFYTSENMKIKVISFEWEVLKEVPSGITNNHGKISEAFDTKYDYLIKRVTYLLGNPKRNKIEKSGRRQTKWRGKKRVSAYMFNFSTYNQIRLYIYKK